MSTPRRTQAERRERTRAAVLDSACRLFGRKGFAETSLEEIAAEAGTTIRPIYHYFESKLGLFEAVNEVMEERIVGLLQDGGGDDLEAWRSYLSLCEDAEFRQIVLVDAPGVLGRERWTTSPVTRTVASRFVGAEGAASERTQVGARMLIGALAEAALAIAESPDPRATGREVEELVARVVSALVPPKEDRS